MATRNRQNRQITRYQYFVLESLSTSVTGSLSSLGGNPSSLTGALRLMEECGLCHQSLSGRWQISGTGRERLELGAPKR
jgi:hypothetical protein